MSPHHWQRQQLRIHVPHAQHRMDRCYAWLGVLMFAVSAVVSVIFIRAVWSVWG